MGVRGLTKFMTDNADCLLKPFALHNTCLVVDGNNLSVKLYTEVSESDSAFGGDYDEYYKVVKNFFSMLLKCQVVPIVLFDGAHEEKKLGTVFRRRTEKLWTLNVINENFSKDNFVSVFLFETFVDVMNDLKISFLRCDFEADVEIATVARVLGCPVLSFDSDFYIYGVLYIPFDRVRREAVKAENAKGKAKYYYVKCSLYSPDFLEEFRGFHKTLLPLLATLLGNDYVDPSIFCKFFTREVNFDSRNNSFSQRKINGLIKRLSGESVKSASECILSHLPNKDIGRASNAIRQSINDYTKSCVSSSVFLGLDDLVRLQNGKGFPDFMKKELKTNLPPIIKEMYYQCKLNSFIMDIVTMGIYFTNLPVEDLRAHSSHNHCFKLISAIYFLLSPFAVKGSPLKVHLRKKMKMEFIEIQANQCNILNSLNLVTILLKPKEIRLKLLHEICGLTENDGATISHFKGEWPLFITACIHWIKEMNNVINLSHIHALVLVAIANKVVQICTGYCRNKSKLKKKKYIYMSNARENDAARQEDRTDEVEINFENLLEKVTATECFLIQQILLPLRQTTGKGRGEAFSISTLHLFSCFQNSLFYIKELNALFNYPFTHMKISNFYSGTLLFNFYISITETSHVDNFGNKLLRDAPNLANIYHYICSKLCPYSVKFKNSNLKLRSVKKVRKERKRRNVERSSGSDSNLTDIPLALDDQHHHHHHIYIDDNNPYSLLQIF